MPAKAGGDETTEMPRHARDDNVEARREGMPAATNGIAANVFGMPASVSGLPAKWSGMPAKADKPLAAVSGFVAEVCGCAPKARQVPAERRAEPSRPTDDAVANAAVGCGQ